MASLLLTVMSLMRVSCLRHNELLNRYLNMMDKDYLPFHSAPSRPKYKAPAGCVGLRIVTFWFQRINFLTPKRKLISLAMLERAVCSRCVTV